MQKVIEIIHSFQLAKIALWINFTGYDIATAQSLRLEINCLVICSFFKKNIESGIRKKHSQIILKHRVTKCQGKVSVNQNKCERSIVQHCTYSQYCALKILL